MSDELDNISNVQSSRLTIKRHKGLKNHTIKVIDMNSKGKININVRRTVENAVCESDDFHFFVDELTIDNHMPTYAGKADEKYKFEKMDDGFFEFLERKSKECGIYIRLIHATGERTGFGYRFNLECGCNRCTFETSDESDVCLFDFADYGIKVLKGEISFGTTIDGGCAHTLYFAEFGSSDADYLSMDNPLNRFVLRILEEMIIRDE